MKLSGAQALIKSLEMEGVEVMFGLCGHTIIALLDALGKSRIRFISTRHEQVAAHAADGWQSYAQAPAACAAGSQARHWSALAKHDQVPNSSE